MDEKFDKLDALILLAGDVLIEENLAYAREVLDPDIVISERTNRRILRYIRHTQKKPTYHPVLNVMKRAAVVMLVLGTVLFASAMSIEAVREKFWNAIVEWYEDYISVLFVDETEDTLTDVEFEVREPSYLPEGLIKENQYKTKFNSYTTYYYEKQEAIRIEQYISSDNDIKLDNTSVFINNININDKYNAILTQYVNADQLYVITWEDEQYRYNIIVKPIFSDKDEIIKMLSSIYE